MSYREIAEHRAAHDDSIWHVRWASPTTIVTASVDETIRVWSTEDGLANCKYIAGGNVITVPQPANPEVTSLVASPSPSSTLAIVGLSSHGSTVASSTMDGCIRFYDVEKGEFLRKIDAGPLETWGISYHPAGALLASATQKGHINLWNTADGSKASVLDSEKAKEGEEKGKWVMSVGYSADGQYLAAGHFSGAITRYDLAAEAALPLKLTPAHTKAVRSVAFSADSRYLYTASDDLHIHHYDLRSGDSLHDFCGHHSWVLALATPPTNSAASSASPTVSSTFASASSDKKIKIWDTITRECNYTYTADSPVWSLAYNDKGDQLASGTEAGTLKLYQTPSA